MATVLIVNPGSASRKYALYRDSSPLFSMRFERTELGFERCAERNGVRQKCEGVTADVFKLSLKHFLETAIEELVIHGYSAIDAAIVRVVVPGTDFQRHTRIDDIFLHRLRDREPTAPLHVPHVLREIETLRHLLPDTLLLSASDSAFHSTMPNMARSYSIDPKEASTLDLYRFGYHGLSAASVVRRLHAVSGERPARAVICHLGGGVSVTAIKDGKSVDTTMGYAPGSGLIMGSRAGDLDAEAMLVLMHAKNLRPLDAQMYVEKRGGLFGLLGEDDLRIVLERSARGEAAAAEALRMFAYAIQKNIAAMTVALGGADSLIFTGTAGERSPILRSLIVAGIEHLGVRLDHEKNDLLVGRDGVASAYGSKIKVVVVRTDEMGEMAAVADMLIGSGRGAGEKEDRRRAGRSDGRPHAVVS